MDKSSILLSVLAILAALFVLPTKLIELLSAWLKYKKEKQEAKIESSAHAAPAKRSYERRRRGLDFWTALVSELIAVLALLSLAVMALPPFVPKDSLYRHIALVGLLVMFWTNTTRVRPF